MNIKAASQHGATDRRIRLEFHQSAAKWDSERERGDDLSLYCAFSSCPAHSSAFLNWVYTLGNIPILEKKNPGEGWWHMGKVLGLLPHPQVRDVRKMNALQSEPT